MFLTAIEPSLTRRGLKRLRKRLAILTASGFVILLFSYFFVQKTLYDGALDQARMQALANADALADTLVKNGDNGLAEIIAAKGEFSLAVLDANHVPLAGDIAPHLIGLVYDAIGQTGENRGTIFSPFGKHVMLVAYREIPASHHMVLAFAPRGLVLGNWWQALLLHGLLLLITLAIMAGLAGWLWLRLQRQHLRAVNLADNFGDWENSLAECGCAILSWSADTPAAPLAASLNWPDILGRHGDGAPLTALGFMEYLGQSSRALLHGPLIENQWPVDHIGSMVDIRTGTGANQRFYLRAHHGGTDGEKRFTTVVLLETAAQQELCSPFETYLHHTPEPAVAVDENGILRGLSPALADLAGPSVYNIIGRPYFEMFIPDDRDDAARNMAISHDDGRPATDARIYRIRDREGQIRWLAWHCVGPFEGMIFGSARDVTPFIENARKLRETLEQLKRSNEDLEQFAYVASHDLQQPLRMVASYTQLLKRRYGGTLEPEADEYIDYAVDGAKRMHKLISHLLEYAKTGTGDDVGDVDCNLALNEAQADLKSVIVQEQATITHNRLPMVNGDRIGLSRLFQNLLSNAIKYRRQGVPPHIDITATIDPEDATIWRFTVRDNGIGIHPEHAQRIFRLFQRLHRDEFSGTGLGLSLCRKIVEQHGGRIWLDTTRPLTDPGATFIFTLPAARG